MGRKKLFHEANALLEIKGTSATNQSAGLKPDPNKGGD
jgi:hypothetical protein